MMSRLVLFFLIATATNLIAQDSIRIENIKANNLEFKCRVIGDFATQPTIVFLHGFPETSHMWEATMRHFNKKGYACIAPDMRGYSSKARPKGVKNYAIEMLVQDIIAITKAKEVESFHLVGHDWGAAIGWAIVGLYPEKVYSWFAMSVPHLIALGSAIKTDKQQRKMSQYANFFQLHGIPEAYLKGNDMANLKKNCWYLSSPKQIKSYEATFAEKGALRSTLHYYRKNWKKMLSIAENIHIKSIKTPTTLVWGSKDTALGRTAVKATQQYMIGDYELIELNAGHWLIQEAEQNILQILEKHLDKIIE